MRNKNLLRNWLILLGSIVLGFFFIKLYWNSLGEPPYSKDNNLQAFVIQKGESVDSIATRLEKEKIIKAAWYFKWVVKSESKADKIQAGDFKLSPAMNLKEIISTLSSGATDRWVTLLEGWRVEEMGAKLSSELGIKKEEFIAQAKSYEGQLFPDTYLFNKDATPGDIISILKNTFNARYSDELKAKITALGLTPEQGVVLASIVEREARSDKVRQQVASILLKRYRIKMGLNADATIQYALGFQENENPPVGGWWKRNLTRDDLKVDSPYNTYLHVGLPPKPICNPSLSSLKAVAEADPSTPYLYYYHDSQGNSYYATTLEEHNDNVANHP